MKVIFCDNHILVVSKPAGLGTQADPGSQDNLTDRAKAWVKNKYDKPGKVFLEPIHRLDKPVSGLVLFARTSKALSRLQEMMREKKIKKTYFAWIEGSPSEERGTLEHSLVHDEHKARVVNASHPEAKLARLHFQVVDRMDKWSYLEIDLETGRYHQIRVQLSAIGCPVIGDAKYGSTFPSKGGKISLHAGRLQFDHPVTKEALSFMDGPVGHQSKGNTHAHQGDNCCHHVEH